MKEIFHLLSKEPVLKEKIIDEKPLDNATTTWIEPRIWCEVQYSMITKNKTFREPVFVRLRQDLE